MKLVHKMKATSKANNSASKKNRVLEGSTKRFHILMRQAIRESLKRLAVDIMKDGTNTARPLQV